METEVKFSPVTSAQKDALFADPSLTPLGPTHILLMKTVYFDDPAHLFSARHWTLRLRQENDRFVCTFKSAAEGLHRTEAEVFAKEIDAGASLLSRAEGLPEGAAAVLASGGFFPVCGAVFTRSVRRCAFGNCVAELSYDEGYLYNGDRREALSEIELELVSGTEAELEALAQSLMKKYTVSPCTRSKQQRAMELKQV